MVPPLHVGKRVCLVIPLQFLVTVELKVVESTKTFQSFGNIFRVFQVFGFLFSGIVFLVGCASAPCLRVLVVVQCMCT